MIRAMTTLKRNPLLALRDDLEISQREIANKLGLTDSAVGSVERGNSRFTPPNLSALWKLYGKDFERLGFTVFDLME